MGIKLTGISTPFGGLTWEYKSSDRIKDFVEISSKKKIKVFISSICGIEKYDRIRVELKKQIESTQLAKVYTFENSGAATVTALEHYTFALEDSDVCVFLIDNADGITKGVQTEIDIVKKCGIKALYYFCDESKKEKTVLEQGLMGANYAKSKTVHKFEELGENGAKDLINDIIDVYHYYCMGKYTVNVEDDSGDVHSIDVAGTEKLQIPTIPKSVLRNIDKCKEYILSYSMSSSYRRFPDEVKNSCDIDEWGARFLPILFEGKSIKDFNLSMYLFELKKEQSEEYHTIVEKRWEAIQSYYLNDIELAITHLNSALQLAKETNQPTWIIKDILIDIRNLHRTLNTAKNCYVQSSAQKELTESSEELYYPILDRLHDSLQERYIEGFYKSKIESPYTISIGNNFEQYGKLLASSYVVSIYNGSLTQILLFYNKIRDYVFYLCGKYSDWNFRRDLLKFAIHEMNEKYIKGVLDSYPEVLNGMDSKNAAIIMAFSESHPILYKRQISRFYAFGAVGYYLNDDVYKSYENIIVNNIKEWLNDEDGCVAIGNSVFFALTGAAYRMSQDTLADICSLFIEKNYLRWYMNLFKFISKRIDLNKMSDASANKLLSNITNILNNEEALVEVRHTPVFLCSLRNQNRKMTEELDAKILEKMPNYYNGDYRLETTEDVQGDFPKFTKKHLDRIKTSNATQGKSGVYSVCGIRSIAIIRAMLMEMEYCCDDSTIDEIILTVTETLLKSKEDFHSKLDAISLLNCIAVRYPNSIKRNQQILNEIVLSIDKVDGIEHAMLSTNIDSVAIKIGMSFFSCAIGIDSYSYILEFMPLIQNDIATTIAVSQTIIEYLEVDEDIIMPKNIDSVVLQNALQWLHSDNLTIRWNATRILLALLRNIENQSVINRQIISLIDSDNVYIKNLILRGINKIKGITIPTKDYVITKCKNDPSFVVRMVCEEEF